MNETQFADTTVRLTDLITQADPVLRNVVFDRCVIDGPVLMQPTGCRFSGNDYGIDDDNADAALWTVHPWTGVLTGAVVVRDCVFTDCTFAGVAFAGEPELLASLRGALAGTRRAS